MNQIERHEEMQRFDDDWLRSSIARLFTATSDGDELRMAHELPLIAFWVLMNLQIPVDDPAAQTLLRVREIIREMLYEEGHAVRSRAGTTSPMVPQSPA